MTTRIRMLDCETTGTEPDAGVVEVGWCDVVLWQGKWITTPPHARLVNPGKPIPPDAMAVHHITNAMVANQPALPNVLSMWNVLDPEIELFAAHRVSFESQFFHIEPPQKWICTYKAAIRLAPNAAKHKNQFLRYWLKLELDPLLAEPPHRAGPDAYVSANILARMLNRETKAGFSALDELLQISGEPVVLPRFTFGEHAMKPLRDVPASYLEWILFKSKGEWDPDVRSTAEHWLRVHGGIQEVA